MADADRIMGIVLIGEEESKRTSFFLKAGADCGEKIFWTSYGELGKQPPSLFEDTVIKIDPMGFQGSSLEEWKENITRYVGTLKSLQSRHKCLFLNTPSAILAALSKKESKAALRASSVATTPEIQVPFHSYEELKQYMFQNHLHHVFLKPNWGSGAFGVMALALSKTKGVLYTSLSSDFQNTKRVFKVVDEKEIENRINRLGQEDVIVERWMPKAMIQEHSFDLRVVVCFGKVVFMVGRLSKSPITNLHLNNHGVDVSDLKLSAEEMEDIQQLALRAVESIPGLSVAGVDILLSKDTRKPYVIELNAQGDYIYKDMYNENLIYKNQVLEMRKMLETFRK